MKAWHLKEINNIENTYGSVEHYCDLMHRMGKATIYDPFIQPGLWEDVDDLVEAPEAGVTVCSVGCMVIGVLWRAILWALVCLLAVKFFGNLHTRLLIEAVKLDYGLV
jgi:hypothetical protein